MELGKALEEGRLPLDDEKGSAYATGAAVEDESAPSDEEKGSAYATGAAFEVAIDR